jgi:hypothetical protein
MTKKDRRIKKDTQRTSRAGGKLSDKKSIGGKDKKRVVVKPPPSKQAPPSRQPEEEEVEEAEEEDLAEEVEKEEAQVPVVRRPTFNIKQTDFVQLTPELASRLLHPNPCCFLTTIPTAVEDSSQDVQPLNASK